MNSLQLTFVCAGAACVLILSRQSAAADTPAEVATTVVQEAAAQPPPINFRILEQRQIRAGNRTVILNRVAPPVLPPVVAPIVPVAPVLSPEAEKELQAREQKVQVLLFLSATVYDHRLTELHWSSAGKTFSAWSSIDFNDIAGGLGEFETAELVCSLMMAIGNETSATLAETNRNVLARDLPESLIKTLPTVEQFSQDRSTYIFAGNDAAESCDPNTLAALDALHVYYDANREELHRAYLERETMRIETERWQKEHPPVRQNTVINYWPIESSIHPVTGGMQP